MSLPHGSVDRNNDTTHVIKSVNGVAPSRERGSKLGVQEDDVPPLQSLPHGSVDRNPDTAADDADFLRRSLTGACIETQVSLRGRDRTFRHFQPAGPATAGTLYTASSR